MVVAVCVPGAVQPNVAVAAENNDMSASGNGTSSYSQLLSRNLWQNEYAPLGSGNWADTVDSALEQRPDGGYDRIEWANDALHVERYSSSFVYQSGKIIDASTYTPTGAKDVLWGGYFKGAQYRFVVTGQTNYAKDDTLAVVRVTKYSLDWQYQGNVEYSGINTKDPFAGGSLRMMEYGGDLWIRTCHEMYNGHQANMTFRIRESDMAKIGSESDVQNYEQSAMGYVSHSFNQYILQAGGKIYAADHGDAYPRAITIKSITSDGSDNEWRSGGATYTVMAFKGTTGDNYTAATFDGFESANNGNTLLAVGTVANQSKAFPESDSSSDAVGAHNIWVSVVSTDGSAVTTKYLTNYAFDQNTTATNPVLVKINENRFLIMWGTQQDRTNPKYTNQDTINYAFMDASGNLTSSVMSMNGALSDCKPTVVGDSVVWYSTGTEKEGSSHIAYSSVEGEAEAIESLNYGAPIFYTIDTQSGASASHNSTVAYFVHFLANGGTGSTTEAVAPNAKATAPKDPTLAHYTFAGWYTDSVGGTEYDFSKPVTSSFILYAQWTHTPHTLYFDGNGGWSTQQSYTAYYGFIVDSLPTATRDGYTFDGWYTQPVGGTKVTSYTFGDSDATLYAHWKANTYTVTFDASDGCTVTPTSKKVTEGQPYGALPTPTCEGYTFAGWYEPGHYIANLEYQNQRQVTSSTTFDALADITLTAHWNVTVYTVSFDSQGGSAVDSQQVWYKNYVSQTAAPTRTGYTFAGWYTAANGGSKYDFSKPVTVNLTLYAHWTANTYLVSFDSEGGSGVAAQKVQYGAKASQPAAPTRTGYTFAGWYTAANGGSKYDFSKPVTGSVTLYAHWTVNSYTLTFNANGGFASEKSRSVAYGKAYGTLPMPSRAGYTFAGWFTAANGGSKVSASTTMGAGNATVYAHWTLNTYAVSFDSQGGSTVAAQKVTSGAKATQPASPTRSGYTFAGWYTAANGGSKYDFSKPVTGNVTLYAHWTKNAQPSNPDKPTNPDKPSNPDKPQQPATYTLTFNANGGFSSEKSRKVQQGKAYGTLPTPTRAGYTFAGWFTAANGGSKVSASTTMGAGNVTIWAHWTATSKPTNPDKPLQPTVATQDMYRLYNPNSGEHFYTASKAEHDMLVGLGWHDEGVGWTAPVKSNTPVYRLYNPNAGDHHYTMSAAEKDMLVRVGWRYEGIGWYSAENAGRAQLYREYNPNAKAGAHNYTLSKAENDHLVSLGWHGEGLAWYAAHA